MQHVSCRPELCVLYMHVWHEFAWFPLFLSLQASFFEGTYYMTNMTDKTPDCDKPF